MQQKKKDRVDGVEYHGGGDARQWNDGVHEKSAERRWREIDSKGVSTCEPEEARGGRE